ncbi:hypothetical protein OAS39_05415, partial [Pirellulales bacterium]|nr:hypothetical protein [Pirellulales bacterium]
LGPYCDPWNLARWVARRAPCHHVAEYLADDVAKTPRVNVVDRYGLFCNGLYGPDSSTARGRFGSRR